MLGVVRGTRELSAILRELRRVLKKGQHIFRRRLYKSIRSATNRIGDLHSEIHSLLEHDSGKIARVNWAFRKSKATRLLARIESHKSTVQLIATTMLLAIAERKHSVLVNLIAEDG